MMRCYIFSFATFWIVSTAIWSRRIDKLELCFTYYRAYLHCGSNLFHFINKVYFRCLGHSLYSCERGWGCEMYIRSSGWEYYLKRICSLLLQLLISTCTTVTYQLSVMNCTCKHLILVCAVKWIDMPYSRVSNTHLW